MARGASSAWAERLRDHSNCVDVLAGTPLETASQQPGYVSLLLAVPDFLPDCLADKWYGELKDVVAEYGAFISRKPNSPADSTPQRYETVQFFRGPCTCKYDYAGTAFHKRFSYRNGDDLGPAVLGDIEDPLGKRPIGR